MLIPPPSTGWSVKDAHLTDWTIVVNNERAFQVNSTALASHSRFFYEAFASQHARAQSQKTAMSRLTRLDYPDLEAVKDLLDYIARIASSAGHTEDAESQTDASKTPPLPPDDRLLCVDRVKSRLRTARHFGVPRLLDAIVSGARQPGGLNHTTCWEVLAAASTGDHDRDSAVGCDVLEQVVLDYALCHFSAAAEAPGFARCVNHRHLRDLLQSDYLNAPSEFLLFDILCHWTEAEEAGRLAHFPGLLSLLRLGRLTTADLDRIAAHPLVRKTEQTACAVLDLAATAAANRNQIMAMRRSNPPLLRELLLPRLPHQAIFLCGGWEGSLHDPIIAPSAAVQLYDPIASTWVRHDTFLPALDTRHAYSACVTLDCVVYLIGGYVQLKTDDEGLAAENQGPTSRVRAYSLHQRVWRERAPMHEARNFVSACRCRYRLYAMGGHNGQHRLASAETYNPEANRWEPIAPMLSVRSDACATSIRDLVFICGGFSGSRFLPTVEHYNPNTQQWTMLAPMSTGRSGLSICAFGKYIYALGGNNGLQRLASVERYDPDANAWSEVAPMLTQRSNFCCAVLHDQLYVIGGWSDQTRTTVRFVERCPQDGTWEPAVRLDLPNSACSCCTIVGCHLIEPLLSPQRYSVYSTT